MQQQLHRFGDALSLHTCLFLLSLNTCEEFRLVHYEQKYVYIQVTQVSYLLETGCKPLLALLDITTILLCTYFESTYDCLLCR